jgi:hypothetical protein
VAEECSASGDWLGINTKRIKPFQVIDEQDGDNLKQLFADYLKSQGKADLLPASN